jgi:hypothetical protein
MHRRKGLLSTAVIVIFIGGIGLAHLMEQPRFQSFHNVDVVQLIASGMCFGVGLMALITMFRKPQES